MTCPFLCITLFSNKPAENLYVLSQKFQYRRKYQDREKGEHMALLNRCLKFEGEDSLSPYLAELANDWEVCYLSYRDAYDRLQQLLGSRPLANPAEGLTSTPIVINGNGALWIHEGPNIIHRLSIPMMLPPEKIDQTGVKQPCENRAA